jgi:hypothetical protein
MSSTISMVLLLVVLAVATSIHGLPFNPSSTLLHKISKRDTTAIVDEKKNTTSTTTSQKDAKDVLTEDKSASSDNGDELIETEPAVQLDEQSPAQSNNAVVGDSNSAERSIDWQLLSGNPADLERELETRRRRRSVHSLSRQHRIRTTAGQRLQRRSRSKRNTYYVEDEDESVNPSDILAAYAYLQARRQADDDRVNEEPQISLLGDVSDSDLSNLASLIYELQNSEDGGAASEPAIVEVPVVEDEQDDQEIIPGGYVELDPTNNEGDGEDDGEDYDQSAIRVTPEELAALERVLNEQQANEEDEDEDQNAIDLYPKDKRSIEPLLIDDGEDEDEEQSALALPDQEDDEEADVSEPTYLIPATLDPSSEYVQIPLSSAYQNPYEFYQTDDDASEYEDEALRRLDEEQLRQRIASLIEDINEQRQIARRRRR